jgi:hypothetical protein
MKVLSKKVSKIRNVRQSELGLFLKLINDDTPLETISSFIDLSKRVSENFNVICKPSDLELFFNLENNLPDENYEVESLKVEYYDEI